MDDLVVPEVLKEFKFPKHNIAIQEGLAVLLDLKQDGALLSNNEGFSTKLVNDSVLLPRSRPSENLKAAQIYKYFNIEYEYTKNLERFKKYINIWDGDGFQV